MFVEASDVGYGLESMLTPLVLSGLAICALVLTTWDAYKAAGSHWKCWRVVTVGAIGTSVIVLQCVQTVKTSRQSQERMVTGLTAELIANNSRMQGLLHPEEQQRLNFPLPELQSAVLKGLLASGTFTGEKDKKMLDLLTLLNERVDDFNQRTRATNQIMDRVTSEERLVWRRKVKESPAYEGTRDTIIKLLRLLVTDYGVDPQRSFFTTLESPTAAPSVPQR